MAERMKDAVQRRGWRQFHWWVGGHNVHRQGGRRGKGGGAASPQPKSSSPATLRSLPCSRCRSSQPQGSTYLDRIGDGATSQNTRRLRLWFPCSLWRWRLARSVALGPMMSSSLGQSPHPTRRRDPDSKSGHRSALRGAIFCVHSVNAYQ
jgi:hypothetical protein